LFSQEHESEYFLAEPLILTAGLVVVSSKPEWIYICTAHALQRVVDHAATPQIAASYFDLFIAMKFAWDKCFRMKVLELAKSAVSETEADNPKSWVNDVKVPEGILPICLNADDSSVLNMFSTGIADKVLVPSVFAGPDVMMGVFLVGNNFYSSHEIEKVSHSESQNNGETTDPRLLYAFRGRKKLNGMDELEDEKSMSTKRQKLRTEAKERLLTLSGQKRGHVILTFEFPESNVVQSLPCVRSRFATLYDIELFIDINNAGKLFEGAEVDAITRFLSSRRF
jgi:hypothetical protein